MSTKERRASQRYAVDLPAELTRGDGEALPCRMVNFCSDGALLVADGLRPAKGAREAGGIEAGQTLTLRLSVGAAASVTLSARVARVDRRKIGVELSRLDPALKRQLLEHSARLKAQAAGAAAAATPPALSGTAVGALRKALRTVVGRHFPPIHEAVLRQCQAGLQARVTSAGSDAESSIAYADQAVLGNATAELADLLATRTRDLTEASDVARRLPRAAQHDEGQALALVEEAEFEAWLTVSGLAHQLEKDLREPLVSLQRILLDMSAGESVDVPFSPEAVARLYQDLPERIDLSAGGRTLFFKAVGRVLADRLTPFYRDLTHTLEERGFRPAAAAASPARGIGPRRPLARGAPSAEADDLDRAIARLHERGPQAAWPRADALRSQLAELLGQLQPTEGGVSPDSTMGGRLDLAERLLAAVDRDPDFGTATHRWLGPLRLLLLQAAVRQPAFHRAVSDPVGKVLGQLEHLGMLVGGGTEARDRETLERIDGLLSRLWKGGVPTPHELERASQVLSVIEAREAADYQQNVARVVASCEGDARIRAAREEVEEELQRRYGDRAAPKLLVDLINGGWQALLQLTHIRQGPGSAEWAARWQVLDALESLLTGPAAAEGPQTERARALLQVIEDGLAYAAYDPYQRGQLSTALRRHLVDAPPADAATELQWSKLIVPRRRRGEPGSPDEADTPPAGVSEEDWRAMLDRVAGLRPGSVLRIKDDGDAEQLRRVAWIDRRRRRHVLVTHRGVKAETLPWQQLARRLHAGQASVQEVSGDTVLHRAADRMLRQMEDSLAASAWHDPLTGLHNRRYLHAAVDRSIAASRSSDVRPALLLLNLDQFKLVNNAYGFEAGDAVLARLGALMKQQFAGPATVAHLAADTFAVLLPDAEADAVLAAAEELRHAVQKIPVGVERAPLRLEASIGLVYIDPLHGEAGKVLSAAEIACATAKESGRNQVAVYRQSDERIARRESSMQSLVQLLEALENDRLRLRCQRIAPIRPVPGRQAHYEVLLTVLDADGAEATLAPFISAAEHYDRMAAVDRAVVRKTLEWMGEHPAAMGSFGGFAINLSGDSLSSPGLVELIEQAFRDTGADPAKVCFEITESLAIANLAKASELIRRIKALGCRFALDDFGSGMSSYAYLKNLPVDLVKIDGAFVKDLASSESDQAVVKSINEISHFLGKETIAEFVENDGILERLRHIGVDYAQGYGIERPRPLAELAPHLLAEAPSGDSAPADPPGRASDAAGRHAEAPPAQPDSDRNLSAVGASTTPRSVTMASISDAGVTSKTGFHAPTPGAPTT